MVRPRLSDLPATNLPAGYSIRVFREGENAVWEGIIRQSFGSEMVFAEAMMSDACYETNRVFFICCGDEPVGTASDWFVPKWGPHVGFLHYVGVVPSHNGRGLGYHVSLAAMNRMRCRGKAKALLLTDDHRRAAIATYLKLSFAPVLAHENQRDRWRVVLSELGGKELVGKFARCLDGPVLEPGSTIPP